MATAYKTALFNAKGGPSSGHGLSRMHTSMHATSGAIATWALNDTIAMGFLPRGAVVADVTLKAAGQLDSNAGPTLALDVGIVGTPQLFKAAVVTVGHAVGATVDTTIAAAGALYANTTGADVQVLVTVRR